MLKLLYKMSLDEMKQQCILVEQKILSECVKFDFVSQFHYILINGICLM